MEQLCALVASNAGFSVCKLDCFVLRISSAGLISGQSISFELVPGISWPSEGVP